MSSVLEVADLAAEQWGLFTTAQARSIGVSAQAVARLTNQGALERMSHGVYRIAGAPPEPFDDLRVAWLGLEPVRRVADRLRDPSPAVVSFRSAALVHALGDLEADEYEFTVEGRKQSRREDVRIHKGGIPPDEWTVVDGMPVTTVLRTVSNLAAAGIDGGHLAGVVRDALTVKQVDDQQLADVLRPFAHRYGEQLGNGEALLARFVQESGVSVPLGRAVELSTARSIKPISTTGLVGSPALTQIQEQLASIQRTLAPTIAAANQPAIQAISREADEMLAQLRISEQLRDLSASATVADQMWEQVATIQRALAPMITTVNPPAIEELQRILAKPEYRRLLDQVAKATKGWQA